MRRERREPRRLLGGIAVLLVVLLGGAFYLGRSGSAPSEASVPPQRSLAVLPLEDATPDPDDAHLAGGLSEELLTRLSTFSGLQVTAGRSVRRYEGSDRGLAEIGQELGVEAVLGGRVRMEGGHLHVSMLLIDVPAGEPLWSAEYEVALGDAPGVEREIAGEVAGALGVQARAGEQRIVTRAGTDSPEAYDLYLRGRYFLNKQSGDALERAEALFLQALDLDPTYPHAWAGLAGAYALSVWYLSLPPEDAYPRARAAAERALELDPELADAHASLAAVLGNYYWDWEGAEHHYRRALALNPSHAAARQGYAENLHRQGRVEEALVHARQARELDPLSPSTERTIGDVLYHARRYDEAVAQYEKVLALHPGYTSVYSHLALAHFGAGRNEHALTALERMNQLGNGDPDWVATLGFGYAAVGRIEEARALLEEVEERAEREHVSPFHRAALHAALGQKERAFELLSEALHERDVLLTYLQMDPVVFNSIRPDPRFVALLESIGLAN